MTLVISKGLTLRKTWQPMDPDAAAYITAVETADTEPLEELTKIAIDNFVLGCKADGIWTAIKASCILAGARTLTGALVPLVGTAPTNVDGLFVSGDYNRKTGLVGDGSTKYLNSNRNSNVDPQNSQHVSAYQTSGNTVSRAILGARTLSPINTTQIGSTSIGSFAVQVRNNNPDQFTGSSAGQQFIGGSRNSPSNEVRRTTGVNYSFNNTSISPPNLNIFIFAFNTDGVPALFSDTARLAFYSIGESLDLSLLDARVTDLINAFAAAIP
jgi:hypothetical protein